ncbi:unnamed protein product [Lota lota]
MVECCVLTVGATPVLPILNLYDAQDVDPTAQDPLDQAWGTRVDRRLGTRGSPDPLDEAGDQRVSRSAGRGWGPEGNQSRWTRHGAPGWTRGPGLRGGGELMEAPCWRTCLVKDVPRGDDADYPPGSAWRTTMGLLMSLEGLQFRMTSKEYSPPTHGSTNGVDQTRNLG